jgi:hypothetical protein
MKQNDVIAYLKKQEIQLAAQLEALQQTIALLQTLSDKNALPNDFSQVIPKNEQKVAKQKNVKASNPVKAIDKVPSEVILNFPSANIVEGKLIPEVDTYNGRTTRPLAIPSKYNMKDSYSKKVVYLLANKGPKTTQELIDAIVKLEPKTPFKTVDQSVRIAGSALFKKTLIKATRQGRKYVYSV